MNPRQSKAIKVWTEVIKKHIKYSEKTNEETETIDKHISQALSDCQLDYDRLKVWTKDNIKDKAEEILVEVERKVKINLEQEPPKEDILQLIAARRRDEATELISSSFLSSNSVYTIRSDTKPEMWIYKEGVYVPEARTHIEEFCREILGQAYTIKIVAEVTAKIQAETYISAEEFFKEEESKYIPVKNGIFNLETSKLEPYDPKRRFFTKINASYNPDADCRQAKKFIESIVKPDDQILIQELFGSVIFREYRFEKAFMFSGRGRNGKSKLQELIKELIGVENCSAIPLQDLVQDPFSMCELHTKLANMSAEVPNKTLQNASAFKALTGRDQINAQRKYLNRLSFKNYAILIFAANELPKTGDMTDAFFLRWIIIDFPYQFLDEKEFSALTSEEKKNKRRADPSIIDKLTSEEELSGLLNYALEGLKRILKEKKYSDSTTMREIQETWIRRSDSLRAFCMDVVTEDYEGYVTKKEFRKSYKDYCRIHRVRCQSDKQIKRTLEEEFGAGDEYRTIDEKRVHIWEGIKLKQQPVQGVQGNPENILKGDLTDYSKNTTQVEHDWSTPEERVEGILRFSGTFPTEHLIQQLSHEDNTHRISEKEAEEVIVKMIRQGDIYEPKPGEVSILK